MTKLKVWSGLQFSTDGTQHRVIVACYTTRQLSLITGLSLYILRNWWSETGNEKMIATATAKPFTIIDTGSIAPSRIIQ